MKRCIFTLLLALFTLSLAVAQNDSLRIVRADWRESTTAVGITLKQAQIKELYGSTQSISLVEIAPSAKRRVGIAGNAGMIKTGNDIATLGEFYAKAYFEKLGKNTFLFALLRFGLFFFFHNGFSP